eukprot:Plantae.Rhodophyta-Purpureofilum_apyrenoidigerum.ctg14367.p1 GENE.Plantae.Rhodophyta-Purpureofilum_apyrenoidigerum.ctg14367~~Plantae.Rhodophyta-Purpureofilum_apyrenoidigerum.ctg14367.p1  ORF type:complete len:147 (-),score=21.15 Plantae.Rhodophyta-Purpureofilum_apyrenoidigerum.ctg14367:585-1025(-)
MELLKILTSDNEAMVAPLAIPEESLITVAVEDSAGHEPRKRRKVECDSEKPFFCDRCFSTFLSKSNLQMHKQAVHEHQKPFNCNHCTYSCTTKGTLTRHVKMVHLHERPFACSACPKRFATRSCVMRHTIARHKKTSKVPIVQEAF